MFNQALNSQLCLLSVNGDCSDQSVRKAGEHDNTLPESGHRLCPLILGVGQDMTPLATSNVI